ncbi:Tn3 family transposase [Streptomyces sp. CEV 2-1]|uniref:Tn3 family transposase n=1 Tax=Streptomyces sp. CEV 2-1 TaxID=2485153 RepID=UPI001607A51E
MSCTPAGCRRPARANRPTKQAEHVHIDTLFSEGGRSVIGLEVIESQLPYPMRVAISVREGAVSSALRLRRLRAGSRKNATYIAFREVGRDPNCSARRHLSDAPVRRRVTAATNKAWL